MLFRCAFISTMCLSLALSQTPQDNLAAQPHTTDSPTFSYTIGSMPPSSCQPGQLFFNTTAVPSSSLYGCTSPDVWTVLGGGYTLLPASATNLGGVTIPASTGLNIDSTGALSLNIGAGLGRCGVFLNRQVFDRHVRRTARKRKASGSNFHRFAHGGGAEVHFARGVIKIASASRHCGKARDALDELVIDEQVLRIFTHRMT